MSMNVGSGDGDEDEVVSTINTTPLVDVMLVLLIIFLITIPVVTTSIPVQLPKERNEVRRADRPVEEGVGAHAAARGADPRRRSRAVRGRGPHHLRLPAGGHCEGGLHYRAAASGRLRWA